MKKRTAAIAILLAVFITAGIVLAQDEKPSSQPPARHRPKELDRANSPYSGRPAPGASSGRSGMNFGSGRGGFDPRSSRPMPGSENASRGDVMQRFDQQIAQRRKEHENAIRELEGIKKVALEEKATKTVALVQKLIDKKNAEFQKVADQIKQYRDRLKERMGAQQQPTQRPEYAQPGGKDNQRPDKQTKAKKPDKKSGSEKNKPKKVF